MGIKHIVQNSFYQIKGQKDAIVDGKSVQYQSTKRSGGGSFFRKEQLSVGGVYFLLTENYSTIDFSDGDAIIASTSGYYTFKLSGANTGGNSRGGVTEASVYMTAEQPLYIKTFATSYAKTGGHGLYLGNVNALQPSGDRPNSTILVAGGGGYAGPNSQVGGGGGLTGGTGGGQQSPDFNTPNYYAIPGGQQTSGGSGGYGGQSGVVWYGGNGGSGGQGSGPGSGGGHGWYGGGGAGGDNQGGHGSGGGGSGYITGVLTNPNAHGHIIVPTANTTTGAANNPSASGTNGTILEIRVGAI